MIPKISKEQKMHIIRQIQQYFRDERGEEIGDLAAEFLIDFMIQQLGPVLYNQAIDDVQAVLNQRMAAFEEDVDALKRPVKFSYQKNGKK